MALTKIMTAVRAGVACEWIVLRAAMSNRSVAPPITWVASHARPAASATAITTPKIGVRLIAVLAPMAVPIYQFGIVLLFWTFDALQHQRPAIGRRRDRRS